MSDKNRRNRDQRSPEASREVKENKEKEPKAPPIEGDVEIVGVNFREAGKIYYFSPKGMTLRLGERVIVETSRGVEMGTVKVANKIVNGKEVVPPLKAVMRVATKEDLERDARNHQAEMDAAMICKKKIREHKLDMSLVGVEYTFDNSKLIFYFTCETRVDFRELVKDLASTFRTRIELRQIGIRDEAKMMGGLGICGRKFCCAGFLTDFVQVTIRMAKEQNFTLNSSKASGACGRLMCCLRYEHEVYEEAIRKTPSNGSIVKTADGEGVVVETKPLASEIKVRFSSGDKDTVKSFKVSDVKVIKSNSKKDSRGKNNDEGAED